MRYFQLICFILLTGHAMGQQWSFELMGGGAVNLPTPLIIRQKGQQDIKLTAHYYTEPLASPVYWVWRFGRWENGKAWEFEAVHHKIYLRNTPPEVQYFGISHGLNLLSVNRSYQWKKFIVRLGAGPVLAHPENKVRGNKNTGEKSIFGMGYYLCGLHLNIVGGMRISLSRRLFFTAEGRFNPSWSRVPVFSGTADVPNLAFQCAAGLGFIFAGKKE